MFSHLTSLTAQTGHTLCDLLWIVKLVINFIKLLLYKLALGIAAAGALKAAFFIDQDAAAIGALTGDILH